MDNYSTSGEFLPYSGKFILRESSCPTVESSTSGEFLPYSGKFNIGKFLPYSGKF